MSITYKRRRRKSKPKKIRWADSSSIQIGSNQLEILRQIDTSEIGCILIHTGDDNYQTKMNRAVIGMADRGLVRRIQNGPKSWGLFLTDIGRKALSQNS